MLLNQFEEIIKTTDPFDLCDSVFILLAKKYGSELNASTEPEPSRTITLVWHSLGLIGNGGFRYLFEGKFNGDPDFSITAEAYKKIGALSAYNRFHKIVQLYNRTSPLDQTFSQCFGDEEETEITNCLAKFIAKNEDEIRKLLQES